jgi:predicted dehydrogenase
MRRGQRRRSSVQEAVVAVADRDPARAKKLAEKTGAQFYSADNLEVISRPEIDAVVVATIEVEHTLPILQALELGKPVLCEKPLALNFAEADKLLAAAKKAGIELRVGYSRRFKDKYLLAKEQLMNGRLGRVTSGMARVFNSRSQAVATLSRLPADTSTISGLVYYVDLMNWLLPDNPPVEVFAKGHGGTIKGAGFANTNDVTYAIVTLKDGAVVNLGVCYALPKHYPSLGHAGRVELIGTDGVLIIDDDHTDQMMYSQHSASHVYLPDHNVNMVFMGSGTPGDWALGDFWGPIANETRAWLDHLATGKKCVLATAQEARANLETTLAIELAADTGRQVTLPLSA